MWIPMGWKTDLNLSAKPLNHVFATRKSPKSSSQASEMPSRWQGGSRERSCLGKRTGWALSEDSSRPIDCGRT